MRDERRVVGERARSQSKWEQPAALARRLATAAATATESHGNGEGNGGVDGATSGHGTASW